VYFRAVILTLGSPGRFDIFPYFGSAKCQ